MSTTRVMPGVRDMEGETVNTLKIGRMVSRHPLRYETTCERCSTRSTESQSRLLSGVARCLAAHCGKTQKSPGGDLLTDQRRQIAEREKQRLADEQAASIARMEAEAADWERPTKYAPTPDPKPAMSAREVAARKERREAEEAAERERMRPIREAEQLAAAKREAAEAANQERAERQRRYWADWVLSDADPKFVFTPALTTVSMSKQTAESHNLNEVQKFTESVPEYADYRTPANAAVIIEYLGRNGARIFDAAMLKATFVRLRDLGILTRNQVEETSPEASDDLVVTSPKAAVPTGPKVYRGRDYLTGRDRDFTEVEVRRMSSLEYQRAFQVAPTISELFSQMDSIR